MQAMCCLDVQGDKAMDLARQFIADSRESDETIAAAQLLMEQAFGAREDSDRMLERHTRRWDVGRLALVDRNILRLAVHEMVSGKTPPKVAITEALRIAQEFSSAESPRFINGILDAVYKELQAGESEAENDG